ncbi:Ftr1 protein [Lanmaoa asiatica]|nr:Ftr1 protein [Lanmaoa asiatica]
MSQNLFSLSIFFVVLREALEASLIVSVLLSLVEQILHDDPSALSAEQATSLPDHSIASTVAHGTPPAHTDPESNPTTITPRILRKLKLQVILGALVGLAIAVAVGAAFVAIWFTQAKNLWSNSEHPNTFPGIFQLIASLMIFVMGVTMLKMENARTKWRIKLQNAFNGQNGDRGAKTSKWVLFILPMITVLREGLEAVVFVGGVALAQPATSIPIATIVGIISGIACGTIVYQFASRTSKFLHPQTLTAFKIFLICMTNLILLIGAGLFSKAVWAFQENAFIHLIGASSDDAGGTGPGTYDVRGNVWHLDCCSSSSGSWSVFNAILGWENSATLGSVLSYVFYWLAVVVVLVYYKFREGRTKIFGWESANGKQRRQRHEAQESGRETTGSPTEKDSQVEVAVAS